MLSLDRASFRVGGKNGIVGEYASSGNKKMAASYLCLQPLALQKPTRD